MKPFVSCAANVSVTQHGRRVCRENLDIDLDSSVAARLPCCDDPE